MPFDHIIVIINTIATCISVATGVWVAYEGSKKAHDHDVS
jgi:hypothetical protein